MSDTGPDSTDPLSPFTHTMIGEALGLHEIFLSLMMGGFTERQALTLIANILVLQRTGPDADGTGEGG